MYNIKIELFYLGLGNFVYSVAFKPQRQATVSDKAIFPLRSFSDSVKDKGKIKTLNNWKDFKINLLPCLWYLMLKSFSLHIHRFPWFTVIYHLSFLFFIALFFLCHFSFASCHPLLEIFSLKHCPNHTYKSPR